MAEKNVKEIPSLTKKKIFQEWNSTCAFCPERSVSSLEIHHIVAREDGGSNAETNLILVCSNCHSKITAGEISIEAVFRKKMEGSKATGQTKKAAPASSNMISGNFHNSVVAGTLNVGKMTVGNGSKTPRINAPEGSIGADVEMCGYITHLVSIYHKFKKADRSVEKMNYTLIYTSIEQNFGAKYKMLPLHRFDEVAAYLKERIDKTILGKNQKAKGIRTYGTFDEYKNKVN